MGSIGRRAFLFTGLATAAAACSRARPSGTQPVTEFIVTTQGRQPTAPMNGLTPAQQIAAVTAAASAWWHPILQAFNRAHPRLRATFGPMEVNPKAFTGGYMTRPNPAVSCQAGRPIVLAGADLSSALRDANLDATALLPGLLAAASDRDGAVRGIPMDFELLVTAYAAAPIRKARLTPPPTAGWTAAQFSAAVNALASAGRTATTFGLGLTTVSGLGLAPAWFGFAEGYGGSVFGSRVTLASGPVYEGLQGYADILKVTWSNKTQTVSRTAGLGFEHLDPTVGTKPWSARSLARFPRLPVAAVPADVLVAEVPTEAPQPAAGATFAVWLATRAGQKALTALGYPPVRADAAGGTAPAWATASATRPSDLRFRPGGIFGLGNAAAPLTLFQFDRRIVMALLQPEAVRLTRLRSLEQALTGVLDGSMTRRQAAAMLDRDGVTA